MKKKSSIGKTNKRKGSNAERYYVKEFKKLGFDKCITSRFGSKIHDDAGIDLIFLPFNVQIKAGKQRGLNNSNILRDINERMARLFPSSSPEHSYPKILIHKKDVGSGKKRDEFDDIVMMSWDDFVKILNFNINDGEETDEGED